MNLEYVLGITISILTLLGLISPFIHRAIRGSVMAEVIERDKKTMKYCGDMLQDSLKAFESRNEEIRKERQLRYSENLDGIRDAMEEIRNILNKIENDMKSYGEVTTKNSYKIETLEKSVAKLEDNKRA